MSDEKRSPAENAGKKVKKETLGGMFYHNTFVLIFSFAVALISWFVLAAGNTEKSLQISDVPINVKLSHAAEEDGLRVFKMSYNSADLEISGSNLITSKLSADDFEVSVNLNPTSTKLTGNTLQKITVPVRAEKKSAISDYSVVSISPEEITLEYDRYKEATFAIEKDEIKYSADSGYYPGTPVVSAESVTVKGPESSVNKISRVAISYTVSNPLKADASFSCPIRLYDQNNQEITDTGSLYLEMDVDTVDVTIPILVKKTVQIVASTVHQPKGFADSRIVIEPASIDIAGSAEVLSGISEIQLDTPIDFAELDISQKNSFTLDIPLPSGVKNISAVGESVVSQATVSVNLNGYKSATVAVPADNFQIANSPADKNVTLSTQSLQVTLIGSDAQVSKLTGDSISVQLDLTNFADRTGSVEVPATIAITGAGSDSCWALGKYRVTVVLASKQSRAVMLANNKAESISSEAVVATPQE